MQSKPKPNKFNKKKDKRETFVYQGKKYYKKEGMTSEEVHRLMECIAFMRLVCSNTKFIREFDKLLKKYSYRQNGT